MWQASQMIDTALRTAAESRPDELALADAPNRNDCFHGEALRLTWAEVDHAVDNLAADLQELGAGPGIGVAIQLPNVAELVVSILAALRVGAVAVPFPIQHRAHELRHGFSTADIGLAITGPRPDRPDQVETMASIIDELAPNTPLAVFGDSGSTPSTPLHIDITQPAARIGAEPVDDIATVCWTSGTTGTPKGVPRTNAMWLASGNFQVDELEITADDRILCPFPLVNMAGIGGMLVPWAIAGAALHLHQPMSLPVFLGQLIGEKITYTVAPPPLLNMLLADESILADADLSSVRKISSGSAPLDPWMVAGWQDKGIEIVNVFGSNEGAAMLSTLATVADPEERARYFPRPDREGVDVRLVDLDTGADITEPDHLGELRFTGPTVFEGYLGSDGTEFDEQGAYRTGDLFEWVDTPPRLLRFVDRAKDIIIRGGMNVSAAEVEGLVSSHESIVECAAVSYPDTVMGEKVGVFVVAAADASPTLDDVTAHLRSLDVASYKHPEHLELIEVLPRNPVGKVVKDELRDRWR